MAALIDATGTAPALREVAATAVDIAADRPGAGARTDPDMKHARWMQGRPKRSRRDAGHALRARKCCRARQQGQTGPDRGARS